MPNKKRQGKWLPFDSLEGHRASLHEAEEQFEKETQPEFSDDKIDEINNIIIQAYQEKLNVKVKIFNNGKIIFKEGCINKIDLLNHFISLDNSKISFNNILDIIIY